VSRPLRRITLVTLPHKAETAEVAAQAIALARHCGAEVWTADSWEAPDLPTHLAESDLLLALGGDGWLIQGARLAAPAGIPIAGVNFGKMGFLAEFEPEEIARGLPRLLSGEYWVEERVTLAVEHQRNGAVVGRHLAVNDALVGRGRINRIVRLHTWVDGQYMTSYAADGLLVATPTGSTASNLAADGPVLPPDIAALVMVPVMPFVSFRNALVLNASSRVDVQVSISAPPPLHEAILSVDGGTTIFVQDGDRLSFTGGAVRCRFARVRPKHYFYAMLVPKLQRSPILPPLPPDTPPPVAS